MWKVTKVYLLFLTIACKDKIHLLVNLADWSKCPNKNKYMHNFLLALYQCFVNSIKISDCAF